MLRLYSYIQPTVTTNFVRYLDKYADDSFLEFFEKVRKPVASQEISQNESLQADARLNMSQDSQGMVQIPQNYNQYKIIKPQKLLFAFSRNKYYQNIQANNLIDIGCLIFDRKDIMLTFNNQSGKTEYINYKSKLWDNKVKINIEEGIVVNFNKLPQNANSLLFYIIINDISKKDKLQHGQFQLEDYQYRVIFDQRQLSQSSGQGDEGAVAGEGEETKIIKQFIYPYYFTKNNIGQWILENVNIQVQTQNAQNEIEKMIEYHKQTCIGQNQQNQILSTMFEQIELDQNLSLQENSQKLLNSLIDGDKDFYNSAANGFEYLVKDKLFKDVSQIRKVRQNGLLSCRYLEIIQANDQEQEGQQDGENQEAEIVEES